MRNIIQLILSLAVFFYALEGYSQTIKYQVSETREEENQNLIHIKMSFQSDKTGITKLLLPNQWTDADKLFGNIININLQNQNMQDAWIVDGAYPYEKYIISQPNACINLDYDLVNNNQHRFKAHINKEYFYFIGKTAFIVPSFQATDELNEIKLQWLIPTNKRNYQIINSYDLEQPFQTISMDELLEGVFLGGNLYISKTGNEKDKIVFAYNKKPSKAQMHWEKDAIDLILTQRMSMNEGDIPYYLVALIEDEQTHESFSATHLKNSALFVHAKDWLSEPREELIRHTAHELFHYWIGQKIKASHDYLASMWFFEGFNDFLSIELALKSKLLTTQAYINIKNRVLKAHYTSPFQSIPNREVVLYYWDNPELHGIPYVKGHLFAQYCNQVLNKQGKSLLDVIPSLAETSSPYYKTHFTESDLINTLAQLISLDIYEAYAKYFIKCEHFSSEIDLALKEYPLKLMDSELPKYDIDIISTFLENRIVGLSKESEAYRLGLREGLPIKHIEIDPLLNTKSIKIDMYDHNNVLKTITINPHYCKEKVPVFGRMIKELLSISQDLPLLHTSIFSGFNENTSDSK